MEGSECDSNASEEFVERPSLKERVANIFHAVLGNGYDIFTKPHTATWIVLFISIAFYICFIFKTSTVYFLILILDSVLNSVRAGVILVCLFIIVFGANQVGWMQLLERSPSSSARDPSSDPTLWSGKLF